MTKLELVKRKIFIQQQWLWMLTNLPDEDLALPDGITKTDAIDNSLDILKSLYKHLEELEDEKDQN